ncbi:protein-tyrosine phosphatase [Solimonas aquatica]|uniref:protein-tyrosine-phosphatase n=1 Tax=Solimonas aquatica TaxID=489703 RepID=A0A1H9L5I2_9GAMM|nr:low molecular weight protein-tyrosine-phosphatase [Solimonas aquatica]SER06273.1 protein-tyrosine phosphatase [Solimonas aquatica]
MPPHTAILFVCLGNICRSPLAEAAFRAHLQAASLALEVDSAGTGDWHIGKPPDHRAQAVALRHGVDISGYRARQVQRADFARYSHIVAMDHSNLAALQALKPEGARAELSLLLDHLDARRGEAVADPYFGDARGFEITWQDVWAGTAALLQRLTQVSA